MYTLYTNILIVTSPAYIIASVKRNLYKNCQWEGFLLDQQDNLCRKYFLILRGLLHLVLRLFYIHAYLWQGKFYDSQNINELYATKSYS